MKVPDVPNKTEESRVVKWINSVEPARSSPRKREDSGKVKVTQKEDQSEAGMPQLHVKGGKRYNA